MAIMQSDTYPTTFAKSHGETRYRYNIREVVVDDLDGGSRAAYECDEVAIAGKVTRAKILEAIRVAELEDDESDVGDAETQYNDAKSAIDLADIAGITYAQLDAYIDSHVTDLASAKAYLKKLSKVVLAMLKRQGWSE